MKHRVSQFKKTVPLVAIAAILLGLIVGSNLFSTNKAEAAPAQGNADYFLKVDGIAGESTDAQHPGEIELNSYAWSKNDIPGLEQSGTTGSGGGGGAGKVQGHDIFFTTNVSKASPQLMLATANGKHIKEAVLSVRKAGKTQQQFMVIKLTDVLVSSYRTTGQDQKLPADEFSLTFAKIEFSYIPQKADGSADTPVIGTWDFKENKSL
jgi:type VI secretion system secreted protein Hcp